MSNAESFAQHKARIEKGYELLEKAYELLDPYLPDWAESELENVMHCVLWMLRHFDNLGSPIVEEEG